MSTKTTVQPVPVLIVQGGQYGSESKGSVAHALAQKFGAQWVCRSGSINAGHSIVMPDGRKVAFQQIPTGAVLPDVNVVIGPGAYVHRETLDKEVAIAGCADRLTLDNNCGVHLDDYTEEARVAGRNLKIGATGKGCAEAIVHKVKDRGVGVPLLFRKRNVGFRFDDTAAVLTDAYRRGERIMLEGTQGTLLDFHCGPYPFVTSRQCISSAWVTEAGLSPALRYEVVLVMRTYPIRVAGNSGPMGTEITWPDLARRINARLAATGHAVLVSPTALAEFDLCMSQARQELERAGAGDSEVGLKTATLALQMMAPDLLGDVMRLFETTTVTKRLRRIAEFDHETARLTVKKEQPAYLALTFLNYVFPELAHTRKLTGEHLDYVGSMQQSLGAWVRFVSIGPRAEDLLEVGGDDRHWLEDRR